MSWNNFIIANHALQKKLVIWSFLFLYYIICNGIFLYLHIYMLLLTITSILYPVAFFYRIIEQNHYQEKFDIWNLFAIFNAGILIIFEVWVFLQDFNEYFFMFLLLASSPVKYAASGVFILSYKFREKINLHLSYIKKYIIRNGYHTCHWFYDWN